MQTLQGVQGVLSDQQQQQSLIITNSANGGISVEISNSFVNNLISSSGVENQNLKKFFVDSFTGSHVFDEKLIVKLGNEKLYCAKTLGDYLSSYTDLRDPINEYEFTPEDLIALSKSLVTIDVTLSEILKNNSKIWSSEKHKKTLPSSPKTSAIKFCLEYLNLSKLHIFLCCELERYSSEGNKLTIYKSWELIKSLSLLLIKLEPLELSKWIIGLRTQIDQAIVNTETDNISDEFLYNPAILNSYYNAVESLSMEINVGLLKGTLKSIEQQIRSIYIDCSSLQQSTQTWHSAASIFDQVT